MRIADWLFDTMIKLGEAGVDSPRRDALVLLEDTLQKDRSWVLAHPEQELTDAELSSVNSLIERRITREPLAYIRKKAWFYGRFFYVDENVLIPRPESETFIELAKTLNPSSVIDVGTGSGCLAITLALELPELDVIATDTSLEAIEICRKNAYAHNVKIKIKQAYLTDGLLEKSAPELLVANLPYVPDNLITSPEIEVEPGAALFGGKNGMDVYESLWAQLSTAAHKPRYVMTEALETQHTAMNGMAVRSGFKLLKTEGLIQKWELV